MERNGEGLACEVKRAREWQRLHVQLSTPFALSSTLLTSSLVPSHCCPHTLAPTLPTLAWQLVLVLGAAVEEPHRARRQRPESMESVWGSVSIRCEGHNPQSAAFPSPLFRLPLTLTSDVHLTPPILPAPSPQLPLPASPHSTHLPCSQSLETALSSAASALLHTAAGAEVTEAAVA